MSENGGNLVPPVCESLQPAISNSKSFLMTLDKEPEVDVRHLAVLRGQIIYSRKKIQRAGKKTY